MLFVGFVSVISLLIAYLSVFISPADLWIPAFFGLGFSVFYVVNFLFGLYWLIRKRKKLFWFVTIVLLLGVTFVSDYFQTGFFKASAEGNPKDIKVMTYNVKLFDLYNWTNNINTRDKMFEIIDSADADILCFQEFYKEKTNRFNTLDTLLEFQKAGYFHEDYSGIKDGTYFFGIITFSKFPIVNKGSFKFESSDNICLFTDILCYGDTVRIYNNHLESIRFGYEDHHYVDNFEDNIEEGELTGLKSIYRRLKDAFIKRAEQTDKISAHIVDCPYPVIVAGDFNDTPVSYTYRKLKKGLRDSFKESGSGIGATYNGHFPSLRIDYIFHDKKMKCVDYSVIKNTYSDHYPIICKLVLPD